MQQVIIIGASHAGAEAAIALRTQGWEGKILLVGDEPTLPYQHPPLSKGYFHQAVTSQQLLIKKQALYEKAKVEVMLGESVTAIDKANKTISLACGSSLSFDYLIIATGARARKLSIPGAELCGINYLRTLSDADQIISQVNAQSHLLVVGAGYIGLEIAASATKLGAKVTVLESFGRVLSRVTNEQMSEFYQNLHNQNGVQIKLNSGVTEFRASGERYVAMLPDGQELTFDSAVIGIGVLPNIELAELAGLACDNGIVVDNKTRTSEPDIFAIGDVSNHPNPFYQRQIRLESVPNAMEQAKVAAAAICGKEKVHDAFPWFWSDQFDVKLQTAGLSQGYDSTVIRGDMAAKKFALFYLKQGKVIAVDAINSPRDFMKAKMLIPTGISISESKLADTTSQWFE
jgi:3-phenylpropionate/trans-cinnamate dioxygenase ferredoxin reductase subunit